MDKKDLQRILDSIGLGKMLSVEKFDTYWKVKTSQGNFLINELSQDEWRTISSEASGDCHIDRWRELYPKIARILFPGAVGERKIYTQFTHKKDKYYSVYKVLR